MAQLEARTEPGAGSWSTGRGFRVGLFDCLHVVTCLLESVAGDVELDNDAVMNQPIDPGGP